MGSRPDPTRSLTYLTPRRRKVSSVPLESRRPDKESLQGEETVYEGPVPWGDSRDETATGAGGSPR